METFRDDMADGIPSPAYYQLGCEHGYEGCAVTTATPAFITPSHSDITVDHPPAITALYPVLVVAG
jgi:hypothetical protein